MFLCLGGNVRGQRAERKRNAGYRPSAVVLGEPGVDLVWMVRDVFVDGLFVGGLLGIEHRRLEIADRQLHARQEAGNLGGVRLEILAGEHVHMFGFSERFFGSSM